MSRLKLSTRAMRAPHAPSWLKGYKAGYRDARDISTIRDLKYQNELLLRDRDTLLARILELTPEREGNEA